MRIAVICAMGEELNSILKVMAAEYSIERHGKFEVYRANYNDYELMFILCGIGKVNAALHTQFIINHFSPHYVINVGVAGGLTSEQVFGDVVVANDLVQHDMDVTAFGIPPGQIPRMEVFAFESSPYLLAAAKNIKAVDFKIHIGRVASGDQFIADRLNADRIFKTFNAIACEMEGAAISHVCYVNKVPFLVVRALSDKAGTDGKEANHSFEELKDMAAQRSSLIVQQLLVNLEKE